MTIARAVLLMPPAFAERASAIALRAGLTLDGVHASTPETLDAAFASLANLLLSFGTSVIVPDAILQKPGLLAVNIHAASPQYPGRDPHHFAAFDGVTEYGATMHLMTRKVDAGPILDVETFHVEPSWHPVDLLRHANEAGFVLARRLFESIAKDGKPPSPNGAQWGPHCYTRKEFLDLGRITSGMSAEEVTRRIRAVAMPGYRNAYLDVHGYRFRIENGDS